MKSEASRIATRQPCGKSTSNYHLKYNSFKFRLWLLQCAALIPVTHRALSDTIIISTGRGKGGAVPNLPVYDKDHTLVLLMAVGRISSLADMLVKEKAYPTDVPVAVIENATCPGVRR